MPDNLPDSVKNYISQKTFPNRFLEWNEVNGIENVVVVPAICEFDNIKKLLTSLIGNSKDSFNKSLILFVINNSKSADPEVKKDNEYSISFLRPIITDKRIEMDSKYIIESGIQIGLIDASSEGFELDTKSAGVGLARKIGMDMALKIFDYSSERKKIIACLDADCVVEENYLSDIRKEFNQNNLTVALVDFEHQGSNDNKIKSGILSYEIFLRHYVCGLLFANSPFAFHTIGSTIVCDHESYIKVGGMNTRKAAEDFYFLQKLAKSFTVERITSTRVYPSARESWRVPFGTGRSMTEFLSGKKTINVFDAEIYAILRQWNEIYYSDLIENPEQVLNQAKIIHPELYNFLIHKNFKEEWSKILDNTNSIKQLDYQRKNWFDAFKTLKLVHQLRDAYFPMIDILAGAQKLFKVIGHSVNFDLSDQANNRAIVLEHISAELKNLENDFYKRKQK